MAGFGSPTTVLERETPAPSTLGRTVAAVARAEFRRWRPGSAAPLTETSAAAAPILREYYRVGVGADVTEAQMRSAAFQSGHPWSAVFISYVMRRAGAGGAFAYAPAHQTYIRAARRNRLSGVRQNPFWAYRAEEVAPRIGDLVCAARSGSGATYDTIGGPGFLAAHCDVVTDVEPGRIRVVGGNVGQTVGEKWLGTLPDGRIDRAGRQASFFAVITTDGARRTIAGGAPVPPGSTTASRAVRVMDLLVRRYGYPVPGAAGLVGNLVAGNTVRGRLPDSAIRSGIEAWTDHLVTGLRRGYPQVDAALRDPGGTVERASDIVLLRFERPRVVVHGRPGDPAVRAALNKRRAYGAQALAAYRRVHP